jgi:hypothetical protein
VQALLVALLAVVLIAGIAAFVLRNLVLAIAVAGALALIPLQFTSTHERADGVARVGIAGSGPVKETRVDASNLDPAYLSHLAETTVNGTPQRVQIRADADTTDSARASVGDAIDRIRATVSAHVPTAADAQAAATAADKALATAQTNANAANADMAAWRAVRGDGNPTELRAVAERRLEGLQRQRKSDDPKAAAAAAAEIPTVQQRVFDLQSAETQLGELTSAVDASKRALASATKKTRATHATLAAAESDTSLVATGPIQIRKVNDSSGALGFALAVLFFACGLAFAAWTLLRRRAETRRLELAAAGPAIHATLTRAPAPPSFDVDTDIDAPRPKEPEPEAIVLDVEPEPEPETQPVVVLAEPEPEPEPIVLDTEPEPEREPEPVVARSERKPLAEPIVFTPAPTPRPERAPESRPAAGRVIRSDVPDLEPMVFEPESLIIESPRPPPKARPRTPEPVRPPEPTPAPAPVPEAEPAAGPGPKVVTVLLYRAPGAKAGEEPVPTFEVRALGPMPPAVTRPPSVEGPAVDLVREERSEPEPNPQPEPEATVDLTEPEPQEVAPEQPVKSPLIIHRSSSGGKTRHLPAKPQERQGE